MEQAITEGRREALVAMATGRILFVGGNDAPVPVDSYDCRVFDECHRGYNLNLQMSDAEVGFRSEAGPSQVPNTNSPPVLVQRLGTNAIAKQGNLFERKI